MTKQSWIKEFDEKFPYAWISWKKTDVLGKITEESTDRMREIKSFISHQIKLAKKEIINDYKNGKRCLNCGSKKKGELSDFCQKCYENG